MKKILILQLSLLLTLNLYGQVRSPDQVKKKSISDEATLKVLKKLNKRIKKLEKNVRDKKKKKDLLSKYKFSGRVYVDTAVYSEDKTALKDGNRITSARMGIGGKVVGNFSFKIKVDLKNNKSSVNQAYIKYSNDYYSVLVGHHGRPTGIENWMSSKHTLFPSGAFVNNAFDQGARIGASINTGNDFFTLMGGIYASALGTTDDKSDPLSFAARATFVPYKGNGLLWHVGAHSVFERKKNDVAFNSGIETNVEKTLIVGTGEFNPTDSYRTSSIETGMTFSSLYLVSEYYMATLDERQDNTGVITNYKFSGYYLAGGFFLTGESRSYGGGAFGGFSPRFPLSKGGFGAFELALRYSYIDLNDTAHDDSLKVFGGEATAKSFGLNWSPEDNVRLLLSYTLVDIEHIQSTKKNESPSVMQARFQIGF